MSTSGAMQTRGLTLRRLGVVNVDYLYLGAHRLRVEAVAPVGGMDPKIFIHHRLPTDTPTGEVYDRFEAVASPVDVAEYPADEPNGESPFFRLDYFEIDLRSTAEAEELWEEIQRIAATTCEALDRLERLVVTEEVVLGPPAESDSASA